MAMIINAYKGDSGDDLITTIQEKLQNCGLVKLPCGTWAEFSEVTKDFTITIRSKRY